MAMEFGWWDKSPEEGKFQISVRIHGGKAEWSRHQGHKTGWDPHTPDESDWDKLIGEAKRRLPRRLLSTKQFEEIEALRTKALR